MRKMILAFSFCMINASCSVLMQNKTPDFQLHTQSTIQPTNIVTISSTESITEITITPTPKVTPTLLPIIEKSINQDDVSWFHYQILEHFGITGGIFDIELDDNGDLLVLTSTEIVRFDGNTWKILSVNPYLKIDEYNDESMISFMKDRSGEFWAGSNYGVLYNYDGKKWTSYPLPVDYAGSRKGNYIFYIVEDNTGRLWIGSHPRHFQDTGLFSLQDRNVWSSYPRDSDIGSVAINGIDIDSQGNIWIVTDRSIVRISEKDYQEYNPTDIWGEYAFHFGISDIEIDNEDVIWLSSDSGWGIAEFDLSKSTVYSLPNDMYGCSGFYSTDENIWVYGHGISGESEPLYQFDGSKWIHYTGFPFFWVRDLLIDNDGSIWLETELGLYNFEP